MTARSHDRGWQTELIEGRWVYSDTKNPVDEKRPCRRCGEPPTEKGHDACVANQPGKESVCCGHGVHEETSI